MMTKTAQKFAALTLALALSASVLAPTRSADAAPTGDEIMKKVASALKLAGSEAVVEMSIGAEKRKLSMATKLFDGGKTEKRVYRFLDPPEIKGTGVLVFDHESGADDVWVFLPAMRKTRRVVSSDRGKSFMGSEFSYADLTIPELTAYTYTLVKEEAAGGEACYVVDVVPKNATAAKEEGYSKKTYWISKATNTVRKGHFFDTSGKHIKTLTSEDVKLVDPASKRYRPMKMIMENLQNGRKSVFKIEQISFAPNTKDEYFTTAFIERT
ncbi:MAG: hypothetical protein B6A08_00700 [Sorangiineae bacterium NIC37A_2]|jgi:outer membrane lipoprotein-sorting protein|nr:MAG: hypothetical protein B6A08_00700 [Sorangiineae bacterium NIC37A_2]